MTWRLLSEAPAAAAFRVGVRDHSARGCSLRLFQLAERDQPPIAEPKSKMLEFGRASGM